ncbi:uncharacterized [Tachysurus ichikawai]
MVHGVEAPVTNGAVGFVKFLKTAESKSAFASLCFCNLKYDSSTEACTKLFKMSDIQVQEKRGDELFLHQSCSLLSTCPTSRRSDPAASAARASIELNGPQITPLFLYSSTAQ